VKVSLTPYTESTPSKLLLRTPDDDTNVFNIFMHRKIETKRSYVVACVKAGDSVDLLAEMDLLVAVAACASEKYPTNHYAAKPIGIQIFN
jgi:uncharacterized protein YcgI (DUF1989 family)